jgi:hypothetical protein
MVEPDNLVLEQLRAIRGELVNEMQTMRVEMTAMRQQMNRLERIEKRLELAD